MSRRTRKIVSVPFVGTLRGARSLPRPVRVLCIAEPIGGALMNSPKAQALLDTICGEPACMFDAERGGLICAEHGGALRNFKKEAEANPFKGAHAHLPEAQRALEAVREVELELCRAHYAANPTATADDFASVRLWALAFTWRMLTYQVRLSTERALVRSDN